MACGRGSDSEDVVDRRIGVRLDAWVSGKVQGVGFRWWVRSQALELGMVGYASNKADRRVHIVAQGPLDSAEQLLTAVRAGRGPGTVDNVVVFWGQPRLGLTGFVER